MKLLECKNLSLGYGTTLIQQNLNISIEQGGYVFILGENGSGKSTLVKTMLGFIKPFAGTIEYAPQWNKKGLAWVGPGKPNLPLGLRGRGKAGGGARVTAGPKRPHLSVCPGPNFPDRKSVV